MKIKNKFYAALAAGTIALTAWTAAAGPARASTSPGPGWTRIQWSHSGWCVGTPNMHRLDPLSEGTCNGSQNQVWYYRVINSGLDTQFVTLGSDQLTWFEAGFSGGQFKLEWAGTYLVNWDQSGGNWSYMNIGESDWAADDNGTFETSCCTNTHWLLSAY